MSLTPKEMLAAVVAAALSVSLALSIVFDSWRWSLGSLGALVLMLSSVLFMSLKRQDATRTAALDRIERKIDNLALRVVTESQATHRELGGLLEELGRTLRGSGTPTS